MSTYRSRPKQVEAIQLTQNINIVISENCCTPGFPGEWLIIDGKDQYVLSDREFRNEFELVKPDYNYLSRKEIAAIKDWEREQEKKYNPYDVGWTDKDQ